MTIDTLSPNVFDVAWPTFAYQDAPDPDEAHDIIRRAQQQAPIALGPYGPEVLSYDLVRTVLRDSRFAMPRGISLVVQGISSGPVWDKVCQTLMSAEPAQHRRLRRLVSRAFTPRAAERMRGHCRNHARSAASGSSGVWLRGRWRWVARCCPVTRQANRSLTCITAIR